MFKNSSKKKKKITLTCSICYHKIFFVKIYGYHYVYRRRFLFFFKLPLYTFSLLVRIHYFMYKKKLNNQTQSEKNRKYNVSLLIRNFFFLYFDGAQNQKPSTHDAHTTINYLSRNHHNKLHSTKCDNNLS